MPADVASIPPVIVPARAALAGNPSDGYEGAVVTTTVPVYAATVRAVDPANEPPDSPLVDATRRRFSHEIAPVDHIGVAIDSTIPESVGLAGSSAIVIAAIRLFAAAADTWLPTGRIAAMAHIIEREDLDIAGGWQDEISQAHASEPNAPATRFMDFDPPIRHHAVAVTADRTIPLYVAHDARQAQSSAIPHGGLTKRADEASVRAAMGDLANEARMAAAALELGAVHQLKQAMDASFDLRAAVMPIEPAHQQMIDIARGGGASANFAGSGGAIVGVVPKDAEAFVATLEAAGLTVVTWNLAP